MPVPPTPILLLKTRSTPHDAYRDVFAPPNFHPTFVPVVEHRYNVGNLARVKQILRDLNGSSALSQAHNATAESPSRPYGGVIFTSQRAVEGFAKVLHDFRNGDVGQQCEDGEVGSMVHLKSIKVPLYVVGPATSRALTELRDAYLPQCSIHGQDTGSGENLAHFMLEHYNGLYYSHDDSETQAGRSERGVRSVTNKDGAEEARKPPLLFLVGEQRRDIIPKTLMAETLPARERIQVDELVIYETGEMESFPADFDASIENARAMVSTRRTDGTNAEGNEEGEDGDKAIWIVVFSPTGCKAMLKGLGWLAEKTGKFESRQKQQGAGSDVFVATIGPTTRDFLKKTFSFEADVCAEKPTPEGVREGIENFMRRGIFKINR